MSNDSKVGGNVRRLVNVIEQCVALTTAPVISEALVTQALQRGKYRVTYFC